MVGMTGSGLQRKANGYSLSGAVNCVSVGVAEGTSYISDPALHSGVRRVQLLDS